MKEASGKGQVAVGRDGKADKSATTRERRRGLRRLDDQIRRHEKRITVKGGDSRARSSTDEREPSANARRSASEASDVDQRVAAAVNDARREIEKKVRTEERRFRRSEVARLRAEAEANLERTVADAEKRVRDAERDRVEELEIWFADAVRRIETLEAGLERMTDSSEPDPGAGDADEGESVAADDGADEAAAEVATDQADSVKQRRNGAALKRSLRSSLASSRRKK